MAFNISANGGYGSGALGTVTYSSGQVNSYANVTAMNDTSVTIGTPSNGVNETFAVGKEILLHVSGAAAATYLGKYLFATITGVSGSVLTLSKNPTALLPAAELSNHHVQAITVAQYDTLNLSATLAPPVYSNTNKYGGIVAIKCKTALNLSGSGKIDLAGKGIPTANKALRPQDTQENTAAAVCQENGITKDRFYLNSPDGAAIIIAATFVNSGTSTRIGTSTAGTAKTYPTVLGGPTILIAANTVSGFEASLVAKAQSTAGGSGLGRCYIATESLLPADEILYALDCLSNPARLVDLGIKNYGTGALGDVTSLSGQINSYANVTTISINGRTLTIGTKYEGNREKFEAGTTVLFHVSRQIGSDQASIGKFIMAKILSVSGSDVTLDTSVSSVFAYNQISNYKCQLITVAQFNNLTCATDYTGAKAYDDSHGCGGILAIAVKNDFNLSSGKLNMAGKGIPAAVSRPAIATQCNGQQKDRLILSQGTGAIFLLAKTLTANAASRIGGITDGALYNGTGAQAAPEYSNGLPGGDAGAGYGGGGGGGGKYGANPGYGTGGDGGDDTANSGTPGYSGGPAAGVGKKLPGGGPGGGPANTGQGGNGAENHGQNGLSGTGWEASPSVGGYAGASIFAVIDTIIGWTLSLFSTGGFGGRGGQGGNPEFGGRVAGGAGGGASGTQFIYCNNIS